MTRINIALLLSGLPAALAYPKHGGFGYSSRHYHPSGQAHATGTVHTHTGWATASYGHDNHTWAGPTGTGNGNVATITVSPLPLSPYAAQSSASSESLDEDAVGKGSEPGACGLATVTVTATNQVTVTVQPSSAAAAESASSPLSFFISSSSSSTSSTSSSFSAVAAVAPVAPIAYSSSASSGFRALSASSSSSSSSLSSPTSSSGQVAYAYSVASSVTPTPVVVPSSTTAALASTSVAAAAQDIASPASSATATASHSSAPPSTGTKRGLAFNTASLTSAFTSAPISWAYNWGDSASGLPSDFEFVPMLWGLGSHTQGWAAAASSAVASGSEYLLGFNEPDENTQDGGSDLTPSQAVTGWQANMQQFSGGNTKLGSPAVTNGGAPMGLTWLSDFVEQCSGCQIDFINIHWYSSSTDSVAAALSDFQSHTQQAITQANGIPVWVTEFQYIGPGDESDFISQALPWLDQTAGVARYSYFMASDGILNTGNGLSTLGEAYASAS
ncbi:hypothetical protein MMC08_000771 [Hypocenomyce scalaris]|nr:hypothetical protein [Hypocenomyce scalaris]